MNILIDIGNTRLKWIFADCAALIHNNVERTDNNKLVNEANGVNSKLTSSAVEKDIQTALGDLCPMYEGVLFYRQQNVCLELRSAWQLLPEPQIVAIASVGATQLVTDMIELIQQLWPQVKLVIPKVSAAAFGVINAYPESEKLGIDRWLTLLAAHQYYPGFTCIVDCGTAVTIDVLTEQGLHLGGVICPGLQTMKQSLAVNTASLGVYTQAHDLALACNTATAIANGTLYAVVGMIENVMTQFPALNQLIVTGGDAVEITAHLSLKSWVDKNLVFKGLSLFC
ncbi:type III pantothenate kinase [Methylomonas sp. AM2-LC]|uniref:type III pantothenate kinase n=1 Tax=Methylomonas sp. AM2-LC TaxID=3153301 RepID=UPI003267C75A